VNEANRIYSDLTGEVVLDNPRVLVQRLVLLPGRSTGGPLHGREQLQVFIKGGFLTSRSTGRATVWKDGRVVWHDAPDPADSGSTNTGDSSIEMVWVSFKPGAPAATVGASAAKPKYAYLDYPNIPGEDLLENELIIVQRFVVAPGQWEGIHAHHPDMLYIHVKGGRWGARSYREAEHPYEHPAADGEVGWMPTIDISEGHESGNIGKEPIDLIWVTLKK
jgi:hypothetical protein